MSQQTINNGQFAGDASAEPLFTAWGKANANFTDLYTQFAAFASQVGITGFSLTGDVTGTYGGGTVPTTIAASAVTASKIAASAVTYAKLQNESASTLLGNPTGAGAAPSEITLGAAFAFSGAALQTVAFTGDVTTAANSVATTIAANAVTNAKAAQMSANTLKGNNTGSTANATDLTAGLVGAMLTVPNVQVLTGSGTYTTPTAADGTRARYIVIEMAGPGGGGAGSGASVGNGSNGSGATTFGTSLLTANAGTGGSTSATPIAGGTATGGDDNFSGGNAVGIFAGTGSFNSGAEGGGNMYGPGGVGGAVGTGASGLAGSNGTFPGSGGGAGSTGSTVVSTGTGGSAGAVLRKLITSPAASYPFAVGTGGAGGAAGTNGGAGGNGSNGYLKVTAYFQ